MTKYALDLGIYHWRHQRGNVIVLGTWQRLEDKIRPCLALIPADREFRDINDRPTPYVISVDKAYIWAEEAGVGDPILAAYSACEIAATLGLSPHQAPFIARLINDLLGDLLKIPPYPYPELQTVAEITMRDPNTGRTVEAEIRE